MLNRIRVVTMLMMVLVIFALLQLTSGGLFFSSLKQNQDSFAASNDLRMQQSELTTTWDLMLQTRINLSRSSARMMMDPNNQQSSAKTELLKNARATLADAAKHYDAFKKIAPQPAMAQASANIDEKYQAYFAGLTELVQFLEKGNMDAYFAQPTQGMQNAPRRGARRVRQSQRRALSLRVHAKPERLPFREMADGGSRPRAGHRAGGRVVRHSSYPS